MRIGKRRAGAHLRRRTTEARKVLAGVSMAFAGFSSGIAETMRFDDFSGYSHTGAMVTNWERFGLAVGEIELGSGFGVGGANVLLGPLRWSAGDNANFRRVNLSITNWTPFHQVEVVLRLETAHGFAAPNRPTTLRLVLEDQAGRFWQTLPAQARVPSTGEFTALRFSLQEGEMGPRGSFSLAEMRTFRLRFENSSEGGVGELAYIDAIRLVPQEVQVLGVRYRDAVELLFDLEWDHFYQLQRSTDLSVWEDEGALIPGNCRPVTRLFRTRGEGREFFRVVVRRE